MRRVQAFPAQQRAEFAGRTLVGFAQKAQFVFGAKPPPLRAGDDFGVRPGRGGHRSRREWTLGHKILLPPYTKLDRGGVQTLIDTEGPLKKRQMTIRSLMTFWK